MTTLVFLDTETTGLDPRLHQAWEVCWWREDESDPVTMWLPHTLANADAQALKVGGYWDRCGGPWAERNGCQVALKRLLVGLRGATLVGANPAFDAAFLTNVIGTPVWHYRLVDVCTGAMWLFGWDRPRSLIETANGVRMLGFDVPEPDHTAEGDVRGVRAIYDALRTIRASRLRWTQAAAL